jgi:hypothetical protein
MTSVHRGALSQDRRPQLLGQGRPEPGHGGGRLARPERAELRAPEAGLTAAHAAIMAGPSAASRYSGSSGLAGTSPSMWLIHPRPR